jgi:hypothetical protein
MVHSVRLTVEPVGKEDIYQDRVRIPVVHRGKIDEGTVCKLSANGELVLVEVRGVRIAGEVADQPATISIDEITRVKVKVHTGQSYPFEMNEVSWPGQFKWRWRASDPTARIAARLGILGFALGVIGVLLGVIALFK